MTPWAEIKGQPGPKGGRSIAIPGSLSYIDDCLFLFSLLIRHTFACRTPLENDHESSEAQRLGTERSHGMDPTRISYRP